jgi:hypothetical protein
MPKPGETVMVGEEALTVIDVLQKGYVVINRVNEDGRNMAISLKRMFWVPRGYWKVNERDYDEPM